MDAERRPVKDAQRRHRPEAVRALGQSLLRKAEQEKAYGHVSSGLQQEAARSFSELMSERGTPEMR